jgi:hypothetical protein
MSDLYSMILGRLADRAIDRALPAAQIVPETHGPVDRARERLARAQATARSLDEVERYGLPLAVLAGVAVSAARR